MSPFATEVIAAAEELMDSMASAIGRRFVGFVHEPWPTCTPRVRAPRAEILDAALRGLGESPNPHLLKTYELADRAGEKQPGTALAPLTTSEPALAAHDVPDWLVTFRLEAFDQTRAELDRISTARQDGGWEPLPTGRAMHSSRWWPGRWPGGDPLGLYDQFRRLEAGVDTGDALHELYIAASDLDVYSRGIATFDPYQWVLAAFRNAPVDSGGLGLA